MIDPDLVAAGGALITVIGIDLALAADNAVVVGMVAARLPSRQRRPAIIIGIALAALLRIAFALFTVRLLQVVGLSLAGGLLLLWVAWKLWRDIRDGGDDPLPAADEAAATGTLIRAIGQIVIADVSMSLENVLAVAGAAGRHIVALVVGLALSVALMGLAANLVAHLLRRYPWLAYAGVVMILWVAIRMIWQGGQAVATLAGL